MNICIHIPHTFNLIIRSSPSPQFPSHPIVPTINISTMHHSSTTSVFESPLPITPVFTCAHCARSQRLGARWGAGTADACGRVFCTYECAWMSLLIQEHSDAAAASALAATQQQNAKAPNSKKQLKQKKRTIAKKQSPVEKTTTQSVDAMVGMAMLFGEWE